MKRILLLAILLTSCHNTKDKYLYSRTCLASHTETKTEYHYGLSYRGKFEGHYGPHTVSICDSVRIDSTFNPYYNRH